MVWLCMLENLCITQVNAQFIGRLYLFLLLVISLVGGSGKTPFIIALTKILRKQGISVAVISRGYGGDSTQMPKLVTPTSTPNEVGDEPCLICPKSVF